MRNFIDYVERTKNEVEGEDYTDLFLEAFSQDLMKVENLDAVKSFILGFLSGSGINITLNKMTLENVIHKEDFKNVGDIIKNLQLPEDINVDDLKKKLSNSLLKLKPIISREKKMQQ